ncbi:MAG: Ig-like domain-containing protein, partial [Gemmatimonadota bacterium]
MRHLRPSRILALLLLAACNSGTTVVEVEVGSINVSPASAALEVGLTLQFTAEVLDDSGSPLTGRTVTWESSVPGVASIDSDGLATGLTEGTTTIT